MDTNQNNNSQNPVAPSQTTGQAAGQNTQPASVTPGGKEAAPLTVPGEVKDFVEPSGHESVPEVPPDVERAGMQITPQHQQVPVSAGQKAAGIQPSGEAVPVNTSSQAGTSVSWTIDEIEKKASGPADNSETWLNKLKLFVLGQRSQR